MVRHMVRAPTGDKSLGRRIRAIRERSALSIRAFSKAIGVSDVSVSRYEKGKSYPSHKILAQIANFGQVDLYWLVGEGEAEIADIEKRTTEHNLERVRYFTKIPLEIGQSIGRDHSGDILKAREFADTIFFRGVEAFHVEDDSLMAVAERGQYLLAIRVEEFKEFKDGDTVLLIANEEHLLVGHIFPGKKKDTYELQSIEKTKPQPSIILREKDIDRKFRIVGVVFERLGPSRDS